MSTKRQRGHLVDQKLTGIESEAMDGDDSIVCLNTVRGATVEIRKRVTAEGERD